MFSTQHAWVTIYLNVFETVTPYWKSHLFPKILSHLESTCQVAAPSMAGLSLLKPMPHHAVSLVPPGFDKSWQSEHCFLDSDEYTIFDIPFHQGLHFTWFCFLNQDHNSDYNPVRERECLKSKRKQAWVRNVTHTTGNQNMTDKMNIYRLKMSASRTFCVVVVDLQGCISTDWWKKTGTCISSLNHHKSWPKGKIIFQTAKYLDNLLWHGVCLQPTRWSMSSPHAWKSRGRPRSWQAKMSMISA